MKYGLIADPHFANRPMFGNATTFKGINSRLQLIRDATMWAIERFAEQEVDNIIFLGDMTHYHGRLTPPELMMLKGVLRRAVSMGMKVYGISGNHDMDGNGLSVLGAFEMEGVTMFNHEEQILMESRVGKEHEFVQMMPYGVADTTSVFQDTVEEGIVHVFCHHHVEGAKHGAHEFRPPGGVKLSDIPESLQVWCGHYHLRHDIGSVKDAEARVHYIGALIQHDFGEAEYTPGVTILETNPNASTFRATFHELPKELFPRFHILPHDTDPDDIPGFVKQDYYRIDLPADTDPKAVRELKKKLTNVRVINVPVVDDDLRSRVEEYLAEREDDCIMHEDGDEAVSTSRVTIPDVIEVYAAMHSEEEERATRLIDLGRDIARSVGLR
jgi:DNA repair exonuclease SbcCD nuclease subunit